MILKASIFQNSFDGKVMSCDVLTFLLIIFQFAFVTCCTHSGESSKTHLHKLNETFEHHGWSEMSSIRHLCACEQNLDAHLIRRRLSVNRFALSSTAELFGVVGVPSIMVINKEGKICFERTINISWN